MELGPLGYMTAFAGSLGLSALLTPIALRLALRWGILDAPGPTKSHESPVPYLGGLAIATAFTVAVAVASLLQPPDANLEQLLVILACAAGLAVVGLVDDMRGLPPAVRVGAQALAGVAVWAVGAGAVFAPAGWLNFAVTVAWVVVITNALNLLDNMDGLSAGVATIAAIAFFGIAATNGQFLVAGLAAALAGCSLGFLCHNFHPARIYMGDAGSLFLGFLLAVIGLRLQLVDTPQTIALFVPVLALGVALFDTALVVVDRLRHGRSPLQGGRDHVSHRLVAVGLPVRVAVVLVYVAAGTLGWLGAILARLDLVAGAMLIALIVVLGGVLFGLLAAVPVYDNSRARRRVLQVLDGEDDAA